MAKHLYITGLVQGVGYRASFERQARNLGLTGWVRSRSDGSVEAMVKGNVEAIQQIVKWAEHGPSNARVDKVMVTEVEDASVTADTFAVHPTQ